MKNIVFILLLVSSSLFCQTEASSGTVDFKIRNAGIMVDGTFDSIQAQLTLRKNKWNEGALNGKVLVKTIKTGISLRDNHLVNDDYFDAEKFPWISLKSISIKETKKGALLGSFKLTIKETTKEIQIPLTYSTEGKNISIAGEFTINRQDFGIGEDSFVLSDDVTINFQASFPEN